MLGKEAHSLAYIRPFAPAYRALKGQNHCQAYVLRRGQSLQQMQEAGVLAKYDHLGKGSIKTASFVELIYNELRGAQPPR